MKAKLVGLMTLFLVTILAVCGAVSATITIQEVELDDDELQDSSANFIRDVERGDEFKVKVHVFSNVSMDDVQIEAYLRGYDHDDRVEDISDVFDMKADVTYVKKLTLKLPQRMDEDRYKLRIRVEDRNGNGEAETYELEVDTGRHVIDIKDVILSPEGSVKSGRALLASVRLKNYGEKDEEGIKVKVSVPDLGISASDYIDELEADESTTSEEIYLRIPSCTKEGTYDLKVQVTYDDGDEEITEMSSIRIIADETCEVPGVAAKPEEKPSIVYDSSAQDVTAQGSIYALTMSNPSNQAKTVTVAVNGVDVFGSVRVSPSNVVVLGAGETKTIYLYVTADEKAKAGQYSFTATISGLSASSQEIALTANVIEETSNLGSVKKALEIGLVALVVILVILGLIIGFNKLKSDEEEADEEEAKTYY